MNGVTVTKEILSLNPRGLRGLKYALVGGTTADTAVSTREG